MCSKAAMRAGRVQKRALQKAIGLLMWMLQPFPYWKHGVALCMPTWRPGLQVWTQKVDSELWLTQYPASRPPRRYWYYGFRGMSLLSYCQETRRAHHASCLQGELTIPSPEVTPYPTSNVRGAGGGGGGIAQQSSPSPFIAQCTELEPHVFPTRG